MTENESIKKIQYRIDTASEIAGKGEDGKAYEDLEKAIQALDEIQRYRAIGTVEEFMRAKEMEAVYGQVKWERDVSLSQLEEIGVGLGQKMDDIKALKEKLENAKEDIRKLLCSEYGSSCQFCIHDENEDAMCCNIGGSGSWCCENARWKEH